MEKYLQKKTVLITGASRGIGKAIAEKLATSGARVAIHFNKNELSAEKTREICGKEAILVQANLSNRPEIDNLFNEVMRQFNTLDILVNNAGIALHSDPLGEDNNWLDDWITTMNINLNSAAYLCKKALTHFLKNSIRGKIINISSRAAFRGDTKDYMAYAASKGGMVSLTRSIARAYGKKGIVAFDVAPGFVNTDMAQQFFNEYGKEYALKDIALDELTKPDDIANIVEFLASGKADHATGGTFDINAGSYVH